MGDRNLASFLPMLGTAIALVFGSGAAFYELQQKPNREEMRQSIEATRVKLEAKQESFDGLEGRISAVEKKQERGQDVQEVLLLQADWQSDVLEHIASKRRGMPPQQPDELKAKRRRLMQ